MTKPMTGTDQGQWDSKESQWGSSALRRVWQWGRGDSDAVNALIQEGCWVVGPAAKSNTVDRYINKRTYNLHVFVTGAVWAQFSVQWREVVHPKLHVK